MTSLDSKSQFTSDSTQHISYLAVDEIRSLKYDLIAQTESLPQIQTINCIIDSATGVISKTNAALDFLSDK